MGADLWFSGIPVHLSHGARELVERAEDVSAEFVCLLAYRARLDEPDCLVRLDLDGASTLSGWLEETGVRAGAERSAIKARLREAVDAVIEFPRELAVFVDRVGERSWLVAGGVTSGDLPADVCYELDLIAESGLCDRAVSITEVEAALESMGCELPDRSPTLGLGGWSAGDDAVAAAEGWGLFATGREPHLEVQCIDTPDPGDGALRDDFAAWDCVLDGLMRGSPVHARAFGALLVQAPGEAAAMVDHWARRVGGADRSQEHRIVPVEQPAGCRPPGRQAGLGR